MLSKYLRDTTRVEKILPFILALLLSGLNFLNVDSLFDKYSILELMHTWTMLSIFFLILWYTNE
jgi:hypothetical protein